MRESLSSSKSILDTLDNYQARVSFYSNEMGIEIVFDNNLEAAAAVPDNSDVTNLKILVNPRLCVDKFWFTPEEFLFVLFHEIEHLFEDESVKKDKNDKDIFQEREKRFINFDKIQKWRAKAYHTLENSLRDVFVNKQVVSPQKIPALWPVITPLYHKLFPSTNYIESLKDDWSYKIPKHMQFVYSLLREWMLPDEVMILDSSVRKIVTRLQRNNSFKEATTWWLKKRLQNIWKLIEPSFTKLLNQDIKELQKDQENPFDKRYESDGNPDHIFDGVFDKETLDIIKKIIKKKLEEKQIKKPRSKEELEIENRVSIARWLKKWTSEFESKKKKLSEYLSYIKWLHNIKDVKTKNSIINELANCFDSIKSRRLKPYYSSKWPVDSEHGVRLHWPSIAEGIWSILQWEDDPYMREKDIVKFKPGEFANNFELTLITDWSGSMTQNNKNQEQKKTCLAIFEWLKILHDKLQQESSEMVSDLNFTTEWLMFDGSSVHTIKKKGTEFTDSQRLQAFSELDRCNWYNNETDALGIIKKDILTWTQEYRENILSWEIKKIIIIISDWLGDIEEIKKHIKYLRWLWLFVYGIMLDTKNIGEKERRDVLSTYQDNQWWNNAYFCKKSEEIVNIVYNLLQNHLTNI
jgi:hypothetical protein